jgi:ribosomal protein S18 acetylase RimI-like enzyme
MSKWHIPCIFLKKGVFMKTIADKTFTIRHAKGNEISFFLAMAAEEGWNPGLYDAFPFFAADPQGFFIGEKGNEKIGCISAVCYENWFGFLGFYIVHPYYRHQGFGLELWNAGMSHLKGRMVGLDGVVAQQDNYRKSGFHLAYNNRRYQGKGHGILSQKLFDIKKISFEKLLEYDSKIFGADRKIFLQNWIGMPNASGFVMLHHNEIIGYGIIRKCLTGYKIGALFADNEEIADCLYQGLCSLAGERDSVFLDVPEINAEAVNLALRYHMKPVFETARMYTKIPSLQSHHKVFGVTSFELG